MAKRTTPNAPTSQFAGTLLDLLDRVTYRRVNLDDLADPVYRLRYDAYRRENLIPANSQRVAGDEYDNAPNAYCFGVYIDDQLVSSVRLHHATPGVRVSPCISLWPEILGPLLAEGKSYIDPSRFTADHEATLAYPALPFLTLRIVAMASVHYRTYWCLSAVRAEHGPFYQRVFLSRRVGDVRTYKELQFPVYLYATEVPAIVDKVYARYPFFKSTPEERKLLFDTDDAATFKRKISATARIAHEVSRQQESASLLA